MTQIDQVTIMGKNLPGGKTKLRTIFLESVNIAAGQSRSVPAPLILDKESEGGRSQSARVDRCIFHTAGSTYVSTDVFSHGVTGIIRWG